ncbi:MAG TPA: hypothetical protein PKK26_02865 [Candidatus Wallbacteria bacterium]|nr:hypothetical protein [Candidatus Wallbacteria bacterium]
MKKLTKPFCVLAISVFLFLAFAVLTIKVHDAFPAPSLNPAGNVYSETMTKEREFLKKLGTNEVKIGTYILNYKNLNVNNGTCTADFYLWLIWSNPGIDPRNFEIMNASIEFKDMVSNETIEIEGRKYSWVNYRVIATTSNDFNFRRYPLDQQSINIEIEDKQLDISKMTYVATPRESTMDSRTKIQGWEIIGSDCGITEHKYSTNFGYTTAGNNSDTYSRYVFATNIARPYFSSVLKMTLPLAVILSLSFISLLLSLDKYSQRISLGVSTVYTSVAFHISLSSAIPQVSYMTLADRLMISIYFMLSLNIISIVAMTALVDREKIETAQKINKALIIIFPIICALVIFLQFGK